MANTENIKKWVQELRSNNYNQGLKALKTLQDDEYLYCCLGVACEIYCNNYSDLKQESGSLSDDSPEIVSFCYNGKCEEGNLPLPVMEWLGIADTNVIVTVNLNKFDINDKCYEKGQIRYYQETPYATTSLTRLNDNGTDFQTIADIIEDNFLT